MCNLGEMNTNDDVDRGGSTSEGLMANPDVVKNIVEMLM